MKRKVVKVDTRNKAFLGAIIGGVSNIIGGAISRRKQRKAQEKAQAQQTELEGYQQAAAMSSAYANQDYVNEYRNKITLKNGGKVKTNDRIKVAKKFACGGRKKANLGTNVREQYKCGGKRTKGLFGLDNATTGGIINGIGTIANAAIAQPQQQVKRSVGYAYTPKTDIKDNSYQVDANNNPINTVNTNTASDRSYYDDRIQRAKFGTKRKCR